MKCSRRISMSMYMTWYLPQVFDTLTSISDEFQVAFIADYLKGASPVPGPTMMMGLEASCGRRKSGFLCTYTGILSPTWKYIHF